MKKEGDCLRLYGHGSGWLAKTASKSSTTSYGSYSGATPNEKITWGKIAKKTPSFIIESDATIVAPLMFAYLLSE